MKKQILLSILCMTLLATVACAGTLELIGMEVDTFSGSGLYLANDLRILPWSGVPVEFNRFYRTARSDVGSALGLGWSHSYSSHLESTTNGVQLVSDDGILFYFTVANLGGDTKYTADLLKGAGSMMRLTNSSLGDVVATSGDNRRYVYYPLTYANPALRGKLREVRLPYSTNAVICCTYDGPGRLVSILDRISGRGFLLSYGAEAESTLLVDIAENFQLPGKESARHCAFSYQDGNLVRATSKGGLPDETYEYTGGRLSRITCGISRDSYIRYNSQGFIAAINDTWNSPRDVSGQPVPNTFSYEADDVVRIRWDDGKDVRLETHLADVPGAMERTRTTVDPVARTTRTESWTVDKLTGDLLKEVDVDGNESIYQYTDSTVSLRQRRLGMVAKEIWQKKYEAQGRLQTTELTGAGEEAAGVISNAYQESVGPDGVRISRLRSQQFRRMKGWITGYDLFGRPLALKRELQGGTVPRVQYFDLNYQDSGLANEKYSIYATHLTHNSLMVVSNIFDAAGRLINIVKSTDGISESEVRYAFEYDSTDHLLQIARTKWIAALFDETRDGPEYTYYTNCVILYAADYDENGRRVQESVLGETFNYSYEGLRRLPLADIGNRLDFERMGAELHLVSRRNAAWTSDVVEKMTTGTAPETRRGWPFWISLAGTGL